MVTIIDYGLGNVRALSNVYCALNIPVKMAKSAEELEGATKLIFPGVGAFDHAMKKFEASNMRAAVEELVLHRKVPILGICVGMQMLALSSEEGVLPGLGWIEGRVRKLAAGQSPYSSQLPHMGWNEVQPRGQSGLFKGLEEGSRFYFLHSYYFDCASDANVLGETEYGSTFSCAVNLGNIFGVQFHPEKSHQNGVKLLKNFAEM